MKRSLFVGVALAVGAVTAASAQTSPPAAQTNPPTAQTNPPTAQTNPPSSTKTSPSPSDQSGLPTPKQAVSDLASTAMGGMKMGNTATAKMQTTSVDSSDLMSSKLVGAAVYNKQNDKLGQIQDLAIASGKGIAGVVIGVGGFLGIGESYVLVKPESLAIENDNGTLKAHLDATKDQLKNAPKFNYSKKGA